MARSSTQHAFDAVIVGSGPNGLAAAVTLAREGLSTLVVEASDAVGGGTRSAELTLPGFVHDICSAIHPMAVASPFFRPLPLSDHGLEWVHPEAPLAHPLDDGTAVLLKRSVDETARQFGTDGDAYRRLIGPFAERAEHLFTDLMGPPQLPRHPLTAARFGRHAIRSAKGLAESWFATEPPRALFAGLAGHSFLPLEQVPSAAIGLMLTVAGHAVGWPMPRGGAQRIADALVSYLQSLGGEVRTNQRVANIDELPPARAILLDVTPRQVLALAEHLLPAGYSRQLAKYRYGPGVFKVDWALHGPIPWQAAACAEAGTVHIGGTMPEICDSERAAWSSQPCERPFVLVAQQSLFDASRAPEGKQVAWGYCHVPHGSTQDMTEQIERQIERFAPGFRDQVLARHTMSTADFERRNANYIGGDINGGVLDFRQLIARPVARINPYATPLHGLYICSASTPPGGGVHGLCGYFAAKAALRRTFGKRSRN